MSKKHITDVATQMGRLFLYFVNTKQTIVTENTAKHTARNMFPVRLNKRIELMPLAEAFEASINDKI